MRSSLVERAEEGPEGLLSDGAVPVFEDMS
jgi:hypothetical protein